MATAEERMKILKMVEEGKVSAEDGAKLLAAINESRKAQAAPAANPSGGQAPWFRVRISDLATGNTKTTMNVPPFAVNADLNRGERLEPHTELTQKNAFLKALKYGARGQS